MTRNPLRRTQILLQIIAMALLVKATAHSAEPATTAQMNCGARVECITPDGQAGPVAKLPDSEPGAAALIMEDDTITCLLQEGRTDFVVELPKASQIDRLTFLNENARARGELKIAISNERLKANSNEWIEVEGIVPFSHKRLFGVSLVGVEARFVRLSFQVEKAGQAAISGRLFASPSVTVAASFPATPSFNASALQEALNSRFAKLYPRELFLTANAISVGPLSGIDR